MATAYPLESDLLASSKKIFPVTPRARFLNMKLLGIAFTLRVRFFDASANPNLCILFMQAGFVGEGTVGLEALEVQFLGTGFER